MEAKLKIDIKDKKLLSIIIVLIVMLILIIVYFRIVNLYRSNNIFAKKSENYSKSLNNPVFKIEKIVIYSDAYIEDISENKNLADVNISQFTDFAIYIDNHLKGEQLTEENTINNIYIDNISITNLQNGEQKIFYKNIKDVCKYRKIEKGVNKLEYKVAHTNSEKENQITDNTFYTDCSEPLVFAYVNENIVKDKDVSNAQKKLSLDGSMLEYLGIEIESINYEISFTINIENNLGEKFYTNCSLKVNLDSPEGGIYTGYISQIFDLTKFDYRFKKL